MILDQTEQGYTYKKDFWKILIITKKEFDFVETFKILLKTIWN